MSEYAKATEIDISTEVKFKHCVGLLHNKTERTEAVFAAEENELCRFSKVTSAAG